MKTTYRNWEKSDKNIYDPYKNQMVAWSQLSKLTTLTARYKTPSFTLCDLSILYQYLDNKSYLIIITQLSSFLSGRSLPSCIYTDLAEGAVQFRYRFWKDRVIKEAALTYSLFIARIYF